MPYSNTESYNSNSHEPAEQSTEIDEVVESFVSAADVPDTVSKKFSELMRGITHRLQNAENEVTVAKERAREAEARAEQAESRVEELEARLSDQENHSAKERASTKSRVSQLEETVEEQESGDSCEDGSCGDNPNGGDSQSTPLETVCALDESTAVRELTSNQRRARAVVKDYTDYARKCPNGLVMKSSEVRRVLTAMEEDTTIYRKTVSRVMEFLSQLGGKGAKIVETRSGQRAICIDVDLAERVTTVDTAEPEGAVTQAIV